MTSSGWICMLGANIFVTTLFCWCVWKITTIQDDKTDETNTENKDA